MYPPAWPGNGMVGAGNDELPAPLGVKGVPVPPTITGGSPVSVPGGPIDGIPGVVTGAADAAVAAF